MEPTQADSRWHGELDNARKGTSNVKAIRLGGGRAGNSRWSVYAFHARGASGRRPCLLESIRSDSGGESSGVTCGPLAPPDGGWPVYTLSRLSSGSAKATVVGVMLEPAIARVQLDFGPGPNVSRPTTPVGQKALHAAKLPRFRYVALAIRRSACLEGVTGYSDTGKVILRTPRYDCTGSPVELPGSY